MLSRVKNKIKREFNNKKLILQYKIGPEYASKKIYKKAFNKELNLDNPKTFNEKLQWLKLYYWPQNEKAIQCADKFRVREFLSERGYGEYLNELYFDWESVGEIDWNKLPDQFVIKCNHGCGYNIICADKSKLDIEKAKKSIKKWMKQKFGHFLAEPHYDKIKPHIICEKFLGGNMVDYKFFCCNGKVEFMYIAEGFGEEGVKKISFFDKFGQEAPFKRSDYPAYDNVKKPQKFEEMKKMSEVLSKDFPFVRVDWFEVEGKIYFSELTFTPGSARIPFEPEIYDEKLGELLDISELIK